jgi:hypothetical protein
MSQITDVTVYFKDVRPMDNQEKTQIVKIDRNST